MEENDVQLQLKKRARRRLVGALAFVSVVAVVLPMVMDHEPRQVVQDVEIRIPGQDEKPFAPKFSAAPVEKSVNKPSDSPPANPPTEVAESRGVAQPTARVVETVKEKSVDKPVEKTPVKVEKLSEKPPEKSTEKALAKPAEKPAAKNEDAKRAAAILGGQPSDAKPVSASGEYLVLIGAFSNEANVKNLKAKLAEQGIRTFSEPLDTPQGKKTRVRAGPFASREAAEKALEKMQRIGVSGAIAAKQ
jgi:DedD protein